MMNPYSEYGRQQDDGLRFDNSGWSHTATAQSEQRENAFRTNSISRRPLPSQAAPGFPLQETVRGEPWQPAYQEPHEKDVTQDYDYTPAFNHDSQPPPPIHDAHNTNTHPRSSSWNPYTLRWWYMLIITAVTLILGIIIIVLDWYSKKNNGLGPDDGSSGLLFGWHFTPTLVSVLYTLLVSMLVTDILRTEPYARMARSGGSLGKFSLFAKSGSWYSPFLDGFSSRKNNGRWNLALISVGLINLLANLVISPLSSSLLLSQEVSLVKDVSFSRLTFDDGDKPLPWVFDRETYFRTVASILQNITTSAWVTDDYMALPFWPSDQGSSAPLGVSVASQAQSWQGETVVMTSELTCEPFTLKSTSHRNVTFYKGEGYSQLSATSPFIHLSTPSGCKYSLGLWHSLGMVLHGGASWAPISNFTTAAYSSDTYNPEKMTRAFTSNFSKECGDDGEVLLLSTAWLPIKTNRLGSDGVYLVPKNYKFLSNFTLNAQHCQESYYMASIPVNATSFSSSSSTSPSVSLDFDTDLYKSKRVKVPTNILNTTELRDQVLNRSTFPSYFTSPEDASRPALGGFTTALGALTEFNLTNMLKDKSLTTQGDRIRRRFLGEALLIAIGSTNSTMQTESFPGQVLTSQQRVVVAPAVAAALAAMAFLSFLLLLIVFWQTRSRGRPLKLQRDPATILAAAELIAHNEDTRLKLDGVDQLPRNHIKRQFKNTTFQTTPGCLHVGGQGDTAHADDTDDESNISTELKSEKVPFILQWTSQTVFLIFMALFLVAIAVLYHFATQSKLHEKFFIYQVTFERFDIAEAPFSIIPTLIASIMGLWWNELEAKLKATQPYLSMAKKPSKLSHGVGLSYQSSYLAWAAVRAAFNGHWLLCLTAFGSTLAQVLTISSSALFIYKDSSLVRTTTVPPSLELRTYPLNWNGSYTYAEYGADNAVYATFLSHLYTSLSTNWMYTATVQLTRNGSQPAWSRDGWSFTPLDLSSVIESASTTSGLVNTTQGSVNVTLTTPAVRGRLECSPVEGFNNRSAWLTSWDLTNHTQWNTSVNPHGYSKGYELGVTNEPDPALGNKNVQRGMIFIPNYHDNAGNTFTYNTSLFNIPDQLVCCGESDSSIGYWSPNSPVMNTYNYSYWSFDTFPANFTVKWLHAPGPALMYQPGKNISIQPYWIHPELPSIQALNCVPVIETATAKVSLDASTQEVYGYDIIDEPTPVETAWKHKLDGYFEIFDYIAYTNLSVSYGVLFQAALLASADLNFLGGSSYGWNTPEDTADQTFNIRDEIEGLNPDFMTYSMYQLAGQNETALLDANILASLADKTFGTFFQHYVSNGVSLKTGGWGYRPINATGVSYLSKRGDGDLSKRGLGLFEERDGKSSSGNKTDVTVTVSTRVQVLSMNAAAVWISVAVLVWLIITSLFLLIVEGRHFARLVRQVECLGDMLVLITSSHQFLGLVRSRGVDALIHGETEWKASLGWFYGADGEKKYGIELDTATEGLLRDGETTHGYDNGQ